jgi:hypothetical protein
VDAIPLAISKMPEDTILPLLLALLMTGLFSALLLKALGTAMLMAIVGALVAALWLWPKAEKHA